MLQTLDPVDPDRDLLRLGQFIPDLFCTVCASPRSCAALIAIFIRSSSSFRAEGLRVRQA